MADKLSYPQIPAVIWWGVRNFLQRTPNAALNERTLGVEFNVQETAARQYLGELKRVGILNDENKATPLAQKWRHDDTYGEAVDEILANAYPEGLIQIAPRGAADRQKIISWFTREGLGSGTAGNKAATYLLISSDAPSDGSARGSSAPQKSSGKEATRSKRVPAQNHPAVVLKPNDERPRSSPMASMPLNINVQIHISAEATGEQIESIFSAMRRYLYDANSN